MGQYSATVYVWSTVASNTHTHTHTHTYIYIFVCRKWENPQETSPGTIGVPGGIWTGSFSNKGSKDILVYIGTPYRLEGSGFEPRRRQNILSSPTRLHSDPPEPNQFTLRVSGLFPRRSSGRVLALATHFHLGSRLTLTSAKHLSFKVWPLNPNRDADGRSHFYCK
jgi:hypothetical protein